MTARATHGSLFTGSERRRIKQIGEPIARLLGRFGFSPDALTIVGFGIVLVAALAAAAGLWTAAGIILVFGTLFDGLDGTLARATNRVTPFGAFLDSSLDRASEVAVYAGIVAGAATSANAVAGSRTEVCGLATLALGTGLLVSYVRARGEGLGISADVGLAQRGERALLLIVGLVAGGAAAPTWLTASLLLISLTSTITVVQRMRFIRARLQATSRSVASRRRRAI